MDWDVFLSHAYEDREFARAIADGLSEKGVRVWFDEFELHVGDSLRRSIDKGLSKSRYGIVVLSPNFFAKEWAQKELDALVARETQKKKVILPIWLNISEKEIRKYSPLLLDKLAIKSDIGVNKIVDQLRLKIKVRKSQRGKIVEHEQVAAALLESNRSLEKAKLEIQAIKAQADDVAHTDSLTFLPNRRMIINILQNEVTRAARYELSLTISMLHVDKFETINDAYGRFIGDQVLRFVVSELRDHVRQPNAVGRYGGAEFLIIQPNNTLEEAVELAARLCKQVRLTPITSDGIEIYATVSLGIAKYMTREESWQELLDRVDRALYRAKQKGPDQWEVAT